MSSSRQKYYKEITRKLNVKAPDEKIYFVAERLLLEYESATAEEKGDIAKELQKIEGILWERHRQLKFWILTMRKSRSFDEIEGFIERKTKCLSTINNIRKALGKKLYTT